MFSQFTSAGTTALEAQIASFNALAAKLVESSEKAIALNIAAAKAYADDTNASTKDMLSAKDPQAFFALAAKQAQSAADSANANARQLNDIAAGLKADFEKAAEAHITDSKSKVAALIDQAINNAPAGSEQAVAILKSAIGNADAGYEQLTKAVKQASETMEAQVANAAEQLTQAVKKAGN